MPLSEEDKFMNEQLAKPHFATWTARQEMNHVREIMRHLYPEDSEMVKKAELAFELICFIDDELE